ncbi:CLUMA_CG019012, isoform A [Clunio marinus]|uniref:CLUMA_CG019012, isoform A n=1 Tax=Clunio marinus TaxID=568069 RepID=A0A1J1J3I8_9DIPT|nr:CLUMA_CG019012, isoform A [Clunio marinus]
MSDGDFKSDLAINEIPLWLNKDYIQSIIGMHSYYNKMNLEVENVDITKCGGKGENFMSHLYRVAVFYKNHFDESNSDDTDESKKPFSCIIKTSHDDKVPNFHLSEMETYRNILPKLRMVHPLAKVNNGFFPEVFKIDRENNALILEDLSEKGYVMADRFKGLDFNHVKLSLEKLALMHASSMIIQEREPNTFVRSTTGFFSRENNDGVPIIYSLFDAFCEEMSKCEVYAYYFEKIRKMRTNLIENGRKAFDVDNNDINVMMHGDFWTNNIMFRYDKNGLPIDAKILDYQFTAYGSPVLDLLYFIMSSTTEELREHKMETMMQFYYHQLRKTAEKLNCKKPIPSLHSFYCTVSKRLNYAFITCFLLLPVMIDPSRKGDFNLLKGTDEESKAYRKSLFQNYKYQSIAKAMIPKFDHLGLFNDNWHC